MLNAYPPTCLLVIDPFSRLVFRLAAASGYTLERQCDLFGGGVSYGQPPPILCFDGENEA